jgi:hypothetical protein
MTDATDGETSGSIGIERGKPDDSEAIGAVGTYEADGGVVFYDTEDPLAWIQSRAAIPLEEAT